MWNRHHGEEAVGVLVKCSGQDEMAQLIEAEPDLYFRPAYYGPSDWIGIKLDRPRVDWDHVAELAAAQLAGDGPAAPDQIAARRRGVLGCAMTNSPSNESAARRRWISFGETIGVVAVAISALGLWNSWRSEEAEKPIAASRGEGRNSDRFPRQGRRATERRWSSLRSNRGMRWNRSLSRLPASPQSRSAAMAGLTASEVQSLVGDAGQRPQSPAL